MWRSCSVGGEREEQAVAQYIEPHSGMNGAGVGYSGGAAACCRLPLHAPHAVGQRRMAILKTQLLLSSLQPDTTHTMAISIFFAAIMLSLCSARQFDEPAPPPLPTAQLATPTIQLMFRRWTQVLLLTITVKTFELLYLYSWQQQQQQQRWRR